jgi:flagellar assembly factor FliW
MKYEVKKSILGFEDVKEIELIEIDELFSNVKSSDNSMSLTVVDPYALREYSFDLPKAIQVLLDIKEDTKFLVYNIVVVKDDLKESIVNFKAPLIFNKDNHTCAQLIISEQEGVAKLGDFLEK